MLKKIFMEQTKHAEIIKTCLPYDVESEEENYKYEVFSPYRHRPIVTTEELNSMDRQSAIFLIDYDLV